MPVRVDKAQVYRPGERLPADDAWLAELAYLMDGSIRIGSWSIGLDPLIGLVPGIGDIIGALVSMVIVVRAVQAGIPRIAIARMLANITIDTLVGSIPVFGDAFDFAYKSNLKNLRIYEDSLYGGRGSTARHWGFFVALFAVVAAVLAAIGLGLVALVHLLIR